MSLSTCDYCGGHIPLGPDAPNLCNGCGRHVFECATLPPIAGINDSELVALRAEVVSLRKENESLKKIERRRWENVNKTFGTSYSTVSDQWQNMPMNMEDLGTFRPGDF